MTARGQSGKLRRTRAGLLVCCLQFTVSATGWSRPPPDKPEDAAPDLLHTVTVTDTVTELLQVLHSRRIISRDDPATRRLILEAIVKSIDCSGSLLDGQAPPDGETAARGTPTSPGLGRTLTVGGIFRYTQILEVSDDSATGLRESLQDVSHGHYEGLIVDLRRAGGRRRDAAQSMVATLADAKLPLVLLMDEQTVGAAEILIAMAKEKCNAVTIGQPTRGFPFPLETVALKSGDVVLLPKIEAQDRSDLLSPIPLEPDIKVDEAPPQDLEPDAADAAHRDDDARKDLCLTRAVDLLTTIAAFGRKHF